VAYVRAVEEGRGSCCNLCIACCTQPKTHIHCSPACLPQAHEGLVGDQMLSAPGGYNVRACCCHTATTHCTCTIEHTTLHTTRVLSLRFTLKAGAAAAARRLRRPHQAASRCGCTAGAGLALQAADAAAAIQRAGSFARQPPGISPVAAAAAVVARSFEHQAHEAQHVIPPPFLPPSGRRGGGGGCQSPSVWSQTPPPLPPPTRPCSHVTCHIHS